MEAEEQEPTQKPAGTIRQISRGVVHQICSGQVVLSLATAAKVNIKTSPGPPGLSLTASSSGTAGEQPGRWGHCGGAEAERSGH